MLALGGAQDAAAAPLQAVLSVRYFVVSAGNPDFGQACCNFYNNLVQSKLGPHALPLYNPQFGGALYARLKVSASNLDPDGELTLWSPALNKTVSPAAMPNGTAAMPFSGHAGAEPGAGYISAVYTGSFSLPKAMTLGVSLKTDDEALLYLDGKLSGAIIGVHPPAQEGQFAGNLSLAAGEHTLTLFYDDRKHPADRLSFSLDTFPFPPQSHQMHGLGFLPDLHHTGPEGCGPLFSQPPCPPN
jgi:hypothetical protein